MQPGWFKPQEVSMAAWAIGKLAAMPQAGHPASDAGALFIRKLLPSALARPSSFDPQGLANLISGVASANAVHPHVLSHSSLPFFPRMAAALRGRLSSFCPQELANSLSGLAKAGAR